MTFITKTGNLLQEICKWVLAFYLVGFYNQFNQLTHSIFLNIPLDIAVLGTLIILLSFDIKGKRLPLNFALFYIIVLNICLLFALEPYIEKLLTLENYAAFHEIHQSLLDFFSLILKTVIFVCFYIAIEKILSYSKKIENLARLFTISLVLSIFMLAFAYRLQLPILTTTFPIIDEHGPTIILYSKEWIIENV